MRLLALMPMLLLALPACVSVEEERAEAAEEARAQAIEETRAAMTTQFEEVLSASVRAVDRAAGTVDRILSPMPVMTPGEEQALRRFLNASHVAAGRAAGTRVEDEAARDALVGAGALMRLPDSTEHWIVRERTAPAYAVPAMAELLRIVGARFQARLADMGLPAYRIEVTSALRTSEHQARLRGSNANAASGVSSHEFGATVDLSYAAFAPPEELPETVPATASPALRPLLERVAALALESVAARKSRELGRIFSQVLHQAQDEGLALVIYERQQTVYHLTVGPSMAAR